MLKKSISQSISWFAKNLIFSSFAFVLVLSGCGGNSTVEEGPNTGGLDNTARLAVLEVINATVVTENPQIAHPIRIRSEINATEAADNVVVAYYALYKPDYDNDAENMRQFVIGEFTYEHLDAGPNELFADMILPKEVTLTGDYYIIASINPPSSGGGKPFPWNIHEDSGDTRGLVDMKMTLEDGSVVPLKGGLGNYLEGDILLQDESLISFHVDDTFKNTPNIVLKSVTIDIPSFELPGNMGGGCPGTLEIPTDLPDSQFGLTAVIYTTGAVDVSGADMEVCLDMDGTCMPIMMWNSTSETFTSSITLPTLEPGIPQELHIDINLDGPNVVDGLIDYLVNWLESHMDDTAGLACAGDCVGGWPPPTVSEIYTCMVECMMNSMTAGAFDIPTFDVVVSLNKDGSILEYEPFGVDVDDDFDIKVNVLPKMAPDPVSGPLYFEKSFAKDFANTNFGAGVAFHASASLDEEGATARGEAVTPVKIFGAGFDMLTFESVAHFIPENIGDASFSMDLDFVGFTIYSRYLDGAVCRDPLAPPDCMRWQKVWSVEKSKEKTQLFMVAIVPVTVTAGASGELGFQIEAAIEENFIADAGPFLDIGAFANAAINLGAASGGVAGELSLVRDEFFGTTTASLSYDVPSATLTGTLHEDVTNDLTGPSGRLYLFVTYPSVKWCKSWGVRYPCGFYNKRAEKNMVNWTSFQKTDILLCKEQAASVVLNP